jgi:alanyl-tRNA synthetase
MQQHTGQHILSQSIYRHLAAGTESLHIGATSSTIDIPVKRLSDTDVGIIEQGANTIVFSDIPIRTYEVGELDETYRKSSSLEGPLRIVEVEGFDKTPCGGTHCRRTGEVGLIKITDYYKKGVFWRIEFVCGGRALARMQSYGSILRRLTALLNVPQEAVPDKVSALLEGMKDAERARDALKDGMAASTLQSCVDSASKVGGVAICTAIVDDAVVAQKMGKLATEMSMTVCIVGAPTDKGPQMVVSASPDSGYNAKELIVPALDALGGKGGGSPQFASGRGADNTLLEQAVAAARLRATEGP